MKRRFSSYGPVELDTEYYVPRTELLNTAITQLIGENIDKGGHYFTVWAPRQNGKSWLLRQTYWHFLKDKRFYSAIIPLEYLKQATESLHSTNSLIGKKKKKTGVELPKIEIMDDLVNIFSNKYFDKPLILILDEFDALEEHIISDLVSQFRNIYLERKNDEEKIYNEKNILLHGLALIGVRSVLGIENQKGSPFNVQRSLYVPNLTHAEVESMFRWYESESGQSVDQEAIDRLFYETAGHPGLVSWFGELLTETYNDEPDKPLTINNLNFIIRKSRTIPSNTITNLISKARNPEYKDTLLDIYKTNEKMAFTFNEPHINYLYMNGIITVDNDDNIKFASPFIQRCLFDYFSYELFMYAGKTLRPFEDTSAMITDTELNIKNILRRYEIYLKDNRHWLFKDAPRRKTDMRIYEVVYHFNIYRYLCNLLEKRKIQVYPEFPTGNGKIDILIQYNGKKYGIELKSFAEMYEYHQAIEQAAIYAKQLNIISLGYMNAFFL